MSLRLEMLQVARLAPKLLGDSTELVEKFLRSQQNDDGGFKDRSGRSDLYYTVFGLEGLLALVGTSSTSSLTEKEVGRGGTRPDHDHRIADAFDKAAEFLSNFGDGDNLDFVHVCALARCWAGLETFFKTSNLDSQTRLALAEKIEGHRTADGGYNQIAGNKFGTTYGCFLAVGAYQDLKLEIPEPLRVVQSLKFLETDDGAWVNDRNLNIGSTNATAAAITTLRQLQMPIHPRAGEWLLQRAQPGGGFLAMPNAPMPDLLSTATALHALAGLQIPFESVKEDCLDFIDSLWTNEGGFCGSWADATLDCEYTYYGLLALGHLSL